MKVCGDWSSPYVVVVAGGSGKSVKVGIETAAKAEAIRRPKSKKRTRSTAMLSQAMKKCRNKKKEEGEFWVALRGGAEVVRGGVTRREERRGFKVARLGEGK